MILTDEALSPRGDVGLVLDDGHVGASDDQAQRPDSEDDQQRVARGEAGAQRVQDAHVPGQRHMSNRAILVSIRFPSIFVYLVKTFFHTLFHLHTF